MASIQSEEAGEETDFLIEELETSSTEAQMAANCGGCDGCSEPGCDSCGSEKIM